MAILKNVLVTVAVILIVLGLIAKVKIGILFGMKPISYIIAANTSLLFALFFKK